MCSKAATCKVFAVFWTQSIFCLTAKKEMYACMRSFFFTFGSPLTVCVYWLAKRGWHPNQCNDYVPDNHEKIHLDQIKTPLENANCSYTSSFDVAGTLKMGHGHQKHTKRGSKWGRHHTKSERSPVNGVCQNSTVKFSTGPDIHSY